MKAKDTQAGMERFGKLGISVNEALDNSRGYFGDITTIKPTQQLTEKELKQIQDMLKPNPEVAEKAKAVMDIVYEQASEITKQYHAALEAECEVVYANAIANRSIKGKPTPAKFKKAGYDVCTQQGVGTYIRLNGKRVSNVIPLPFA